MTEQLLSFIRESNAIEGIHREVRRSELVAHQNFLRIRRLEIFDLRQFVKAIQPGAEIRDKAGMNVRVGPHVPPPGGPEIKPALEALLEKAFVQVGEQQAAWEVHMEYETLHPFMDGNGRSGRVLWLWMMGAAGLSLNFLHRFYYQTLQFSRRP